MKKRIFTIIALLIFLLCFYSTILSNAATLEEQKEQVEEEKENAEKELEYVQGEISASLIRVQELDDNIRKSQNEIENLGTQLEELQKQVEETEEKLKIKEEKYYNKKDLLEKRLAAMYEAGEMTYLQVLFKSSSIIEFISNYYYLQEIARSDIELLNNIQEEKEKLELEQKKLSEQKANLKLLKAKQEQTYIAMQNNKTIQQSYIDQLSEDEKELQNKIAEYKAEEQRIQNLINFASGMGYDGEYTGGLMAWPVAKSGTYITSDYGVREHPVYGVTKKHTGIDIGNAGYGAPVIAAADGVVSYADTLGGYGQCVIINHGNGISTLYGHGQAIHTTVGAKVKKGDLIMEVGSTGVSTGPHLHFEVRINGNNVDPKPYLQ